MMATIIAKFGVGDKVTHFTNVDGMITAVFHRASRNSYEMSFCANGVPTCVCVEECEITTPNDNNLGFKKGVV